MRLSAYIVRHHLLSSSASFPSLPPMGVILQGTYQLMFCSLNSILESASRSTQTVTFPNLPIPWTQWIFTATKGTSIVLRVSESLRSSLVYEQKQVQQGLCHQFNKIWLRFLSRPENPLWAQFGGCSNLGSHLPLLHLYISTPTLQSLQAYNLTCLRPSPKPVQQGIKSQAVDQTHSCPTHQLSPEWG